MYLFIEKIDIFLTQECSFVENLVKFFDKIASKTDCLTNIDL